MHMLDFTAVEKKDIIVTFSENSRIWNDSYCWKTLKTPKHVTVIRCYGNMKKTVFTEIPFYKSVELTYRVIECKPKNLIYNYTRTVILCKLLWIFLLIFLWDISKI